MSSRPVWMHWCAVACGLWSYATSARPGFEPCVWHTVQLSVTISLGAPARVAASVVVAARTRLLDASCSCSVAACRTAPSRSRAHKLGLDARAALRCAMRARAPLASCGRHSAGVADLDDTHRSMSHQIRTTTLPTVRKHVLDRVGHALHSTHTLTALLAPYKLYHHINVPPSLPLGYEGRPFPCPCGSRCRSDICGVWDCCSRCKQAAVHAQ